MAVPLRINSNKRGVLARFKTLINSQSFHSPVPKGPMRDQLSPETDACRGRIDIAKWKTMDARKLGITSSMISQPSWYILKLLRNKGFKSYLVGGCVRDLLLNRTPKDFDVITTAKLMEVRKQFRRVARAEVVGRRFPVCLVHVKGSVVEVTSFETVTQTSKGTEQFLYSLLPKCSDEEDLFRCKNSLRRDFTINSLFYDPFANKIYDYANGMADLRSLKLETVLPAQLSFKEDPGRILRGFRIAARLGLSLSRETEAAIWTYSSLVKSLNKDKIMIELNYMLSYGAAEPSLRLLWKFKLLEFLLPVHAAYLDEQATKEDAQASNMLMKLFFHLDNLVGCARPSDCTLWIGLLAFHLVLVDNPQDALVVWALASVLYHGEWEKGVKFAKERAKMCVNFAPEIKRSTMYKSDEEIAKAVSKLAYLVMDSIPALVENNSLLQSLSRYPSFPRSGIVFVPKKAGKNVSAIFKVLVNDIKFYKSERKSSKINYDLLGRGHLSETGFVLGKIVLETMSSGIVGDGVDVEAENCHLKTQGTKEIGQLQLSDLVNHQLVAMKDKRRVLSTPSPDHRQEKIKKRKLVENECFAEKQKMGSENLDLFEKFEYKKTNEEHQKLIKLRQKVDLSMTKDSLPKRKIGQLQLSDLVNPQLAAMKDKRRVLSTPSPDRRREKIKKRKLVENECIAEKQKTGSGNLELFEKFECKKTNEEHQKLVKLRQKVDLSMTKDSLPKKKISHRKQLINDGKKSASAGKSSLDPARHLKIDEDDTCTSSQSTVSKNHQVIANNTIINADVKTTNESDSKKKMHLSRRQQSHKRKQSLPPLSKLFK